MGTAVSCDSEYLNSICAKRIDKWRQCIKAMAPLADPQLEALLLRSCIGASKMVYLLRCLPPQLISDSINTMEDVLLNTLRSIIVGDGPGFGDFQFNLATLPSSFSGLGIYNPADISYFAFIASMQATKSLQDGIIGCGSELPTEFTESRQRFLGYLNKENIELPHFNQTTLATLFYETKRSKLLSSEYITSQPLPLQQRFMAILDSVKQRWAFSYLCYS